MFLNFIQFTGLFLFNISIAISQTSIDARHFYELAHSHCSAIAPDIQMYNLVGTNLDSSGKSQNWNCRFVSFEQTKKVYYYSYSADTVILDSVSGVLIGPGVVDSNWINSDRAIEIAEQNGGETYRTINKNYHINAYLNCYPAPPFFTYWDIAYTDLNLISPAFNIRINAITEDLISHIKSTKKSDFIKSFTLLGNQPNPFNNYTIIHFKLEKRGVVKLKIFDLLGKEIDEILNVSLIPNTYKISWNAEKYASGIYFYTLIVDNEIETRQLVLIK